MKTLHFRSFEMLAIATGAMLLVLVGGCSRQWHRLRADREAECLVEQKGGYFDGGRVDADPLSRLADPNAIDCPPQPPDDPQSHALMHCVDGKKGYQGWGDFGRVSRVDSMHWLESLPMDEQGTVRLDLREAVRVARLHSRDYQRNVENLYLSALDVSFERFRFDHQFSGGTRVDQVYRGRSVGATSPLLLESFAGTRKLTATGGELVVGFANSLLWDFWGDNTDVFSSALDFSIVQPLLRFGGRARVLENLTQSERNLLANVRQMEQYRQGFFLDIVAGRNSGPGPSTGNNVGQAGLGVIAGTPSGRSGAPSAGGYLGLLQDQQEIRNRVANVAALRDSLAQLEAAFDSNRISTRLQVDQARQALLNGQSSLLTAKAAYESRIDGFKIDLGLPPDLELVVEDPALDQFVLIDPDLTDIQTDLEVVLSEIRAVRYSPTDEFIAEARKRIAEFRESIEEQLSRADEDMQLLDESLEQRKEQLQRVAEKIRTLQADVDRNVYDEDQLVDRSDELKQRLPAIRKAFDEKLTLLAGDEPLETEEEKKRKEEDKDETKTPEKSDELDAFRTTRSEVERREATPQEKSWKGLSEAAIKVSDLLLELSLVRAEVRLQGISLQNTDTEAPEAIEYARANRLDWMNARANLVDTWRKIEFFANELESDLDVVMDGRLGTEPDNIFEFDSDRSRLRFGLRFDTPTARLAERNRYRVALLNYQRARRDYMLFEDRVVQSIRNTIRIIALSEINLEVRRAAVQVAIAQVDNARLKLNPPLKPGQTKGGSPTAARDLVSALSDLLDAQNDFLNVWVSNQVLRIVLDFEMGTMQLDPTGVWIDPAEGESALISSGISSGTNSGGSTQDSRGGKSSPLEEDLSSEKELSLDATREADWEAALSELRLTDPVDPQPPLELDFSQLLQDPQNLRE